MSTAISLPGVSLPPVTLGTSAPPQTLAELVYRLGDVPLDRIRMQPPPGTATLTDVAECKAKQNCLCELVEGVLVEKPMGYRESIVALTMAFALRAYNKTHKRGLISGADGMLQIFPNLVRLPDVAYTSWARFPSGHVPPDPAPLAWPEVAVEVLSPSNTRREMERKRAEYFAAGTRLVWMVDSDDRTVSVYTGPDKFTVLHESDTLDGGEVLPGFALPLKEVFAELDEQAPPKDS